MNIKIFFGFWLISICLTPILLGQSANIRISHFGIEDGISHNLVTEIEKDLFGYIWLGSPNGLNRFDGYEFLQFNSFSPTPSKLSENYIDHIALIENGNLAITYNGNLNLVDFINPSTFEVHTVDLFANLGVGSHVINIFSEKNGKVYILWEEKNAFRISRINDNGKLELVLKFDAINVKSEEPIFFLKRRNGDFIVGNNQMEWIMVNKGGVVPLSFGDEKIETRLAFLKEDREDRVWLSTEKHKGVYLLNDEKKTFSLFETPLGAVNFAKLWEDEKGNLIFGQSDKIVFAPIASLVLLDVNDQFYDFSSFKQIGKYIINLEGDDFFNTTLGTTDIGLKIIKNNATTIQTMLTENSENGSRNRVMRGFAAGEGDELYFAQEDGPWFSLDIVTNERVAHNLIDRRTGKEIKLNCSTQLYFDEKTKYLWGITCDPSFGGGYLLRVDPKTFQTDKYRFPKKIRAFTRTKDGVFWLACANNSLDAEIFTFEPSNKKIQVYTTQEGFNPIRKAYPTFIKNSTSGNLLVGTLKGLYEINPKSGSVDIYDVEEGLSSNSIEALLETADSQLVIGTSRGLNILSKRNKEVRQILKEDGLSSNHIYSIQVGQQEGTYWIGTIYGLTYFDSNNSIFKNFFERDGLSHNEFNRFSHFKDKNGRLYFGGVNGINIFNEDDLLKIDPAPKVMLTKMQYFDGKNNETTILQTELSELDKIVLKPNDKYLELFFSLPEYSDPKNNQFQYKLEGYDKDWNLLGRNNRILFNSLPPNKYKLLVKGAGSKGNWGLEAYELNINVEHIFYKTWKFWLFCTILLGVFLQLINQYLFKQKLKVERIRTKLSSDLHDEVSGLLSGIAMQSELLEMITSDEKNKDKLKKITQTSRSAMSRMGDVIWSIDSRKDTVEDLLARMSEHVMDILDPLDVAWKMEIKNLNREKKMPVLIRENLYFIFKEAINNIGKHAVTDNVKIEIGNYKDQFILSIYNNSLGAESNKKSQKTGQGAANMIMRAKKIEAILEKKVDENGFTVLLKRKRFV